MQKMEINDRLPLGAARAVTYFRFRINLLLPLSLYQEDAYASFAYRFEEYF